MAEGLGDGEELFGVVEEGNFAADAGGEVGKDPKVDGDEGKAEDEGERGAKPLAEAGVAEVKMEAEAHAGGAGAETVNEEGAEDDTEEAAPGDGGDTEVMEKQNAAQDHADVVDERGEGLEGELLAGEQDSAEDAAGEEEDLAGEDDAGEVDAERELLGVAGKAGEEEADVGGGKELGEEDGCAQDEEHRRENDGQGFLRFGFLTALTVAGEHGDEGDGGGAADEEVRKGVGKLEHGAEGVGGRAFAEEKGNVLDADERDDLGKKGGSGEQEGGSEGGLGLGGAQGG